MSSPSGPRSNSTSLRRLLSFLRGSVIASGDVGGGNGGGGNGGGGNGGALLGDVDDADWTGVVAIFPAGSPEDMVAVAVEGAQTVFASVSVAARPRRRRRRRWRFLTVAAIADVVGRLQVMVTT